MQQGTQAAVAYISGMLTDAPSTSRALPVSDPNQHRKVPRGSTKLQFSVFRSKIEFHNL